MSTNSNTNQYIRQDKPALVLAPMEGVFDAPMRALIAEIGGFDFAVSEFIRVSQEIIPARATLKCVPELTGKKLGKVNLPVQVQLLGSDPELITETAIEACSVGASAIDLNFGCPSPTVIRKHGGSALLKDTIKIHKIVKKVRSTLPDIIPVSAKIRLGWENATDVHEIVKAITDGGANWITIHARTRKEVYKPGVHWDHVRDVVQSSRIPIVANGDLFKLNDLKNCKRITNCQHFMIGRGVVLNPFIGRTFAKELAIPISENLLINSHSNPKADNLLTAICRFIEIAEPFSQNKGYVPKRIKQWVSMIRDINFESVPRPLMTAIGKAKTTKELVTLLDSLF